MVEDLRDPNRRDPARFARESFSMRPAASWQVGAMAVAAVAVVVLLLLYVMV